MGPGAAAAKAGVVKALAMATGMSLLCVCAFGIYLLSQKVGPEFVVGLLLVPFSMHLVVLYLLLRRPGPNSIFAGVLVAFLGGGLALAVLGLTLVDWAMSGSPVLPLVLLVYVICQGQVLYLSRKWNR